MAGLGGDGPVRELQWHFEAAAHPERHEIILREIAEIARDAVQRVVLWIDGPDDFVHRAREVARGIVDAVELRGDLRGMFQIAVRGLAQERDAREVCAEMVVDVLGDARAFTLDGLLALRVFQFAAQATAGNLPAFTMFAGLVMWMHAVAYGSLVLGAGIIAVLYTFFAWWSKVIAEAHAGDHTPVVSLHLRYGMILFIASEAFRAAAGVRL